jgi:hypothetical protein
MARGAGSSNWSLVRGGDPVLEARFAVESPDMAIEMLQPLDAWGAVESLKAWLLLAKDPARAGSDSNAPAGAGVGEDPIVTLSRCAPVPRVVQFSIVLKRNVSPSTQGLAGAQPAAQSSTIARWVLPLRAGTASCAVLGRESSEVGDYDVEVAQLAAAADPQMYFAFDGLALTLEPGIATSGDLTLDIGACAHVKRGDTREFDPRVPTLGRMQQSTYDQLSTREKLVFAKGANGPRRVVLGDAAGAPGSLTLEVEVAE